MAGNRRAEERPPTSMIWDGSKQRAREIDDWARDSAFNARWQWRAGHAARLLVQLDGEQGGQEWAPVPLGAVVRREGDPKDKDAPLVLLSPSGPHVYVPE